MRRCAERRRALLAVWIVFLLALLAVPISAEDGASAPSESMPREFFDFLEALPEHLRDLLPENLLSENPEEVHGAVRGMSDISYLLTTVLSLLGITLGRCVRILATVAGILILSAVCRAVQSSLRSTVAKAFSLCTTWIMLVLLFGEGYTQVARTTEYFSSLIALTSASIPLLGALYAMGGNVSSAVASTAGLSVFMTLLEGGIGKTVVPFCGICLALTLVSTLDPALRVGTLLSTVKRQYTTALTFFMTLLIAMVSSQAVLSARADTLAMKSAKFAAGKFIPVLGGSLSELLRALSVSVGYLRGTVGICALLLLLLLLLPPVVELLLLRLTWQICAALADLLGCDTEKRILEEFSSVGGYLIAAMCICSSVLLLSFTLLTNCAAALG